MVSDNSKIHVASASRSEWSIALINVVEVVTAFALVFGAARLLHLVWGWNLSEIYVLSVFYTLKLLVTGLARIERTAGILAFCCLFFLLAAYEVFTVWDSPIPPFGRFVLTPLVIAGVPTLTFAADVTSSKRHSFRMLLWRSVLEILVLIPLWACLVGFVAWVFGWKF